MTSGRLTPAAATRISTSCGSNSGTGRLAGRSARGGPGSDTSIAVIVCGTGVIRPLEYAGERIAGSRFEPAVLRRDPASGAGRDHVHRIRSALAAHAAADGARSH